MVGTKSDVIRKAKHLTILKAHNIDFVRSACDLFITNIILYRKDKKKTVFKFSTEY